jgi:uncharacterized membrane-anchored protein
MVVLMSLTSRRPLVAAPGPVTGPVKLDRRTRRLAGRLRPGDVALIDHIDLDRIAAESLVAAKVAAVLNARPSSSGRYPNLGPDHLVAAGIPLVDNLGDGVFQHLREGSVVTIEAGTVLVGGVPVGHGVRQDAATVAKALADARPAVPARLESLAANAAAALRHQRALLLDGAGIPEVRTKIDGRHCVVVVRGFGYRTDLASLRPYIREVKPVLIGVDGGADALLDAGYRPDLIVGDMDDVSDPALRGGAELVVRVWPDGRGDGLARLKQLNLPAVPFPAAASSADLAMLLADGRGATVIVAVGTPATLEAWLDRGRAGMASAFLTRLKVGAKLVDAETAARVHRQGTPASAVALLVVSALTAMAATIAASTVGSPVLDTLIRWWDGLMYDVQRLF